MDTVQLQIAVIDRVAENEIIPQRVTDGYVNATAMCKACGKQIGHYWELGVTKAFLEALSTDIGMTISELVHAVKGGMPKLQGTWVHPQVAINLGQWLSPQFAVAVSKWVLEWTTGAVKNIPYHLRRYMMNMSSVPYGYFSMLNEVTLALIGPMERQGYIMPSSMIPDGSLGKMFSNYLRGQGYPVDEYPRYLHRYEDGREFEARAYPNALIGELRRYFTETWLKDKSREYFMKRDAKALPYLDQILALPNYREVMGYIDMT